MAIIPWLRLLRIPNVFTALADVLMGILFARGDWQPASLSVCLGLASCLFYLAGMVWNDVFDLAQDRVERPHRPLPSEEISIAAAARAGIGLMLVGIVFVGVAAIRRGPSQEGIAWSLFLISVALVGAIFTYDGWLKRTWLGPLAMGSCRSLNVALGMSAATWPSITAIDDLPWDRVAILAGYGLYIAGVTWFARREANASSRRSLMAATLLITLGLALWAQFPFLGKAAEELRGTAIRRDAWPWLIGLLGFVVVKRCLVAVATPEPRYVQAAVVQCIRSTVLLNAAACLVLADSSLYAILVVLLLLPMLWLSNYVAMT